MAPGGVTYSGGTVVQGIGILLEGKRLDWPLPAPPWTVFPLQCTSPMLPRLTASQLRTETFTNCELK